MSRRISGGYAGSSWTTVSATRVRWGATEVERFLSDLAVRGQVAASTQKQALSALLFLYCGVLELQLPWINDIHRAQRPERLPTVLSRDEVQALLAQPSGPGGMT